MSTFGSPTSAVPAHHAAGPLEDENDTFLIFRSAGAFDRMTAQMRRAMGINAHERLAISLLWGNGPMTMSELGAGIPLSRAAVTTLVDRLEHMGYVVRGGDANDRRRTVVTVTEAGTSRVGPLVGTWKQRMSELRAEMGEAAWETVRTYLVRAHDIANEHADALARLDDEELRALAQSAEAEVNQ